MAARAGRPRKTDCDPSTDFNLCACEREYSIEAARHPERATDVPAPAGGVKGKRPSAVAARPLTPSSSRALGSYAMLRIATRYRSALTRGATSYSAISEEVSTDLWPKPAISPPEVSTDSAAERARRVRAPASRIAS